MALDIGTVLLQWQSAGVFDYLLPFLLIFALVFAILQKSGILGDQKGIHAIIAVVIGFLALQLDFVPVFFREIFPRLGVAVAVILALLILVALFVNFGDATTKWPNYVMMGVGVIAFLIIVSQTFQSYPWFSSWYSSDLIGWIILGVLFAALIIVVAVSSSGSDKKPKKEAE